MDQHVEMKNASTPAPQSKEEDNEVLDRVMQTLATAQEQLMKVKSDKWHEIFLVILSSQYNFRDAFGSRSLPEPTTSGF